MRRPSSGADVRWLSAGRPGYRSDRLQARRLSGRSTFVWTLAFRSRRAGPRGCLARRGVLGCIGHECCGTSEDARRCSCCRRQCGCCRRRRLGGWPVGGWPGKWEIHDGDRQYRVPWRSQGHLETDVARGQLHIHVHRDDRQERDHLWDLLDRGRKHHLQTEERCLFVDAAQRLRSHHALPGRRGLPLQTERS